MQIASLIKATVVSLPLVVAIVAPANAETYAVILNPENNYAENPDKAKAQLRRIFLKQQQSWPGGTNATAFDRETGTPIQTAFVQHVLGMSESEVEAHWLKVKQTDGETPPRAVGSSRILLRLVSKTPGGFGFVTKTEAEDADEPVKVLFEFSD